MLEEVPVRIYSELQFVVFDGTPDGFAVKADEDRRCLAEINFGRIAFNTRNVLRPDGALVYISKHAVERDNAVFFRNIFLDRFYDLSRLLFRERLEISLGDLECRELY